MATTQLPLASGSISAPTASTVYINTGSDPIQPMLVISNSSDANAAEVRVSFEDGVTDVPIGRKKIAAGAGKAWRVLAASDVRMAANDAIKIEVISGDIQFTLSGIVFSATA